MKFDLVLSMPPKDIFAEVKALAIDSLAKGSSAFLIDNSGRVHVCTRLPKSKSFSKILNRKSMK